MTKSPSARTQSLADQVDIALAMCRDQVEGDLSGFAQGQAKALRRPEGCFSLLDNFPEAGGQLRRVKRLAEAVQAARSPFPPGTLERYVLLQAFRQALPRLAGEPIDDMTKQRVCAACLQVTRPMPQWSAYFDHTTRAFHQMAKVATLRWYPANQLAFEFTGLPRSWLLKIHPFALPELIRVVAGRFGGRGPVLTPHLWAWRANPYLVLKSEHERSLWRMAQTMALRPEVKGLMSVSWYHCAAVGEAIPHLAWLHDFFIEQGAFLVDMEPAPPDAGFMAGSAKRRELYRQGKFRPRQTLVLWHRAAMLSWAAAHPELGEEPAAQCRPNFAAAGAPRHGATTSKNPETLPALQNRKYSDMRISDIINNNPKLYIFIMLIAPSIIIGVITSIANMWWACTLTIPATFAFMWFFQYFFLQ